MKLHRYLKVIGFRTIFVVPGGILLAIAAFLFYSAAVAKPVRGGTGIPGAALSFLGGQVVFCLGTMFIALGLVVPNPSWHPTLGRHGFTPRERKFFIAGALLVGIGPIAGIAVSIGIGGFIPFLVPAVFGFGFLFAAGGSRFYRAMRSRMRSKRGYIYKSVMHSCRRVFGHDGLAVIRTALIVGGGLVVFLYRCVVLDVLGCGSVYTPSFEPISMWMVFSWGSAVMAGGSLVPGESNRLWLTVPDFEYSYLQFKFVAFGALFTVLGPMIYLFVFFLDGWLSFLPMFLLGPLYFTLFALGAGSSWIGGLTILIGFSGKILASLSARWS